MQQHNPEELIQKYLAGKCTAEEKSLVESWCLKELSESPYTPSGEQIDAVHQRMQAALAQHIRAERRRPVTERIWFRAAAAAIVAGAISTIAWWYKQPGHTGEHAVLAAHAAIQPGHDGAVLTLADGRKMVLDSLANGLLTMQQGTKVLLNNGQLTYQADGTNAMTGAYNTINTPRGRQFRVTLPDGSKVWLNAASSISYPTAFTGRQRKVEVKGEAYFEVTENPSMPFIVKANDVQVQVLGTYFNINAYTDEEAIKTTLLEGAVKVTKDAATALLNPGQQAAVSNSPSKSNQSPSILVQVADTTQVVAWKNGVFNFQNVTLEKMMRKLARWYDIEVAYEKGIPDIAFEGEVNRQNELADVLHILEHMGVHFRLEGRRLTVLP